MLLKYWFYDFWNQKKEGGGGEKGEEEKLEEADNLDVLIRVRWKF